MRQLIASLVALPGATLETMAQHLSRLLGGVEWKLAALLLAMERSGVPKAYGFGSVVSYAINHLEIPAAKASDLVRVARALECLPLLCAAFRDRRLSWSKIRAVTRVATAATEQEWLVYALHHSAQDVERHAVISPRGFHKDRKARQDDKPEPSSKDSQPAPEPPGGDCEKPQDEGQGEGDARAQNLGANAADGQTSLFPDDPDAEATPSGSGAPQPEAGDTSGDRPRVKPCADEEKSGTESDSAAGGEGSGRPAPPAAGRRVSPNVHFTEAEFLEVEQVKKRMEAQCGRHMSWSRFVYELCKNTQPAEGRRPRINAMVLVHVSAESGQAWTETERGNVSVSEDVVADAMASGRVAVIGDDVATGSSDANADADSRSAHPEQPGVRPVQACDTSKPSRRDRVSRRKARTPITAALMRSLFLRARGRCEKCGGRGPLHVDHMKPWDDHPVHELSGLQVLCIPCHVVKHEVDFERRKGWREAKAGRMALRRARRSREDIHVG